MQRKSYLVLALGFLLFPLLLASGFLLFTVLLAGCSTVPDPWKNAKPGQKRVLVSFPPLYCITSAVAGDKAYVSSLLTTQGPHHYEGTPLDVLKVNGADLYIYSGLTMEEGFNRQMLNNRTNRKLVTLDLGSALLKKNPNLIIQLKEEIKHQNPDGTWHTHGNQDPHYWLGIQQAKAMTEVIAEQLSALDGANAKHYAEGKTDFLKKLDELQAYCDSAFQNKKNRKFVTQHDSLRYFAQNFGAKENAIPIQVQPGIDPDAKSIADLREKMEKEGVRVIAIEPQYSPAQAESLQASLKRKGIDITIITLDPLETAPRMEDGDNPDPEYYLKKMRENIDTLAKALP